MESLEPYIELLELEARNLREDTLVSMFEGIANEHMADRLETIASDLKRFLRIDPRKV